MKRWMSVGISLMALMLIGYASAGEPHRMGGQMQMEGQGGQQEQSPGQQPMMGRGMMGQGMMGHGMMGMMCPMMAMMDPSGMGMMGGQQMDPKAVGRRLQLRGDILKAVGEVLIKHGKAMEEGQ